MNVEPSLISNSQSSEAVEPSQRPLHHPAVPTQLLAALHSSPGDPSPYASLSQSLPVGLGVVAFVGVHFTRTLAWSASPPFALEGGNGVNHRLQHRSVRNISSRALHRQRYSASTDHNMALRAWFAFIRRVLANCLVCGLRSALPFFTPLAGTVAESMEARDQPISPASLSLSSSTLCSLSHTPACCQSRRRRQQVIPLPQPISWGSISHCKPVLSTNRMPVRAARLEMRGRPPLGLGGSGGSSGSITSHNWSDSNALAMLYFTSPTRFC
jgi:hypothetical protein